MQRKTLLASAALASALSMSAPASAQNVLTGDTRLACEAVLCLATGTRPSECMPSLRRYFSISSKKLKDTIRGRLNFLNLCPVSNQTPEMSSLVNAMANGAGRCDAASLNSTLRSWNFDDSNYVYISNQIPGYCAAYTTHSYTNLGDIAPKYVGAPERGGYWVEAQNYATAIAEYNARIAAEDAARRNNFFGN
jgi:hypothetical protein